LAVGRKIGEYDFKLANGLSIDSTQNDVKRIMGDPTSSDNFETYDYVSYWYYVNDTTGETIKFQFDKSLMVTDIELTYALKE
jgi:outer membrane protein assembly factor BamE (lipoprotein component of BamABCDE complex)